MEIQEILTELDQLFARRQIDQVETFLEDHIRHAEECRNIGNQITLLNELLGFYRDMTQFEKAMEVSQQIMQVLNTEKMQGTIPYATSVLNIANALRAAGEQEASMTFYQQVLQIYEKHIDKNDFRYASLYNNLSLLYQDMGDYESACQVLEQALTIVIQHDGAMIEVATTHTNLAISYMKQDKLESALEHLNIALLIFEQHINDTRETDYHYSAALATMGEIKYRLGVLEESIYYYEKAMQELNHHTGKTKNYEIIEQNYLEVINEFKKQGKSLRINKNYEKGMDLCEDFYLEYGKPMIQAKFPQYETMIAVGLVGEGSECFGFDDEVSRDHDFGPGFCMWLSDAVYDEIGTALQKEYELLPNVYMGVRRFNTTQAGKRVGVFRISDFYEHLIGMRDIPESRNQWLFVEEYQLASATNGKVFQDDLGEFTRIRKGLQAYYPYEVWTKRVAREATLMAQSGQYNYQRMLRREEIVTARFALTDFMKHTISMVYLLNRSYAPFYKWMHRGMLQLSILRQVHDLLIELEQLPITDKKVSDKIEEIARLIIEQMQRLGLTKSRDNYLDSHTNAILESKDQASSRELTHEELVAMIVKLEWEAFHKVENIGGRADCQDNWETFSIMRSSQFMTWPTEVIASYIKDSNQANASGWNLITEKYARMMQSTDPDGFRRIQFQLPKLEQQRQQIIEEIVKIQVSWMEDFAEKYPEIARNARAIHTMDDSLFTTSYETYLRGELSTYGEVTLSLYGKFIVQLYHADKNLAQLIIENTAQLYGYDNLEAMEAKLTSQ